MYVCGHSGAWDDTAWRSEGAGRVFEDPSAGVGPPKIDILPGANARTYLDLATELNALRARVLELESLVGTLMGSRAGSVQPKGEAPRRRVPPQSSRSRGRPAKLTAEDIAWAKAARRDGRSVPSLAKELQVGASTLYAALKKRGASSEKPNGISGDAPSDEETSAPVTKASRVERAGCSPVRPAEILDAASEDPAEVSRKSGGISRDISRTAAPDGSGEFSDTSGTAPSAETRVESEPSDAIVDSRKSGGISRDITENAEFLGGSPEGQTVSGKSGGISGHVPETPEFPDDGEFPDAVNGSSGVQSLVKSRASATPADSRKSAGISRHVSGAPDFLETSEFSDTTSVARPEKTGVKSRPSAADGDSRNSVEFPESGSRGGGRSDLSKQSFSKRTPQPPIEFSDTDFPDTALDELEAYALHRLPATSPNRPRAGGDVASVRSRLAARRAEGFTDEEIRRALDAGARLGHQLDTVLRSAKKLRKYRDREDALRARMLPAAQRARVQSIAIDSYHAALENVPVGARFERVEEGSTDGSVRTECVNLEQLVHALFVRDAWLLDPTIWREATIALTRDGFWSARDPLDAGAAGEGKRSATTLLQVARQEWRERGWLKRLARRGRQIERVEVEEAEAARITEAAESKTRSEDTRAGVRAALAAWAETVPTSDVPAMFGAPEGGECREAV